MKSRRMISLIGLAFVLMLLTLVLAACQDAATPTQSSSTIGTTTSVANTTVVVTTQAVTTSTQLPTFTSAPTTQALPTVTPALTTLATTTAAATTIATTTIATTTIAPTDTTTTAAVTDTSTVAPTDTTSVATTTAVTTASIATTTKAAITPKPTTTVAVKTSPVFNSVLAALRRQKEVAVVLPTYIPGTDAGTVYAVIERSDKPGYGIILGYTPDCDGGTACRIGSVTGTTVKAGTADLKGTKVGLGPNKTIAGYYNPASCGANCDDATITWREGNGVYSVGIKAGDVDELTRMANSAIAAGRV